MLLPPIGTPLAEISGAILSAVMRLKQESRLVRAPYEEMADICRNYFHYGAVEPPEDGQVVCNDIQNDVIIQADIQTKEPPSISFEPEDTGEKPRDYLDPEAVPPQLASQLDLQELQASQGPDGTAMPPQMLSPRSLAVVRQAMAAGLLPADALYEVSTSEREDLVQKVFDAIMRRSDVAIWFREHALWNNVDGWAFASYEFDDARKRFSLSNKSVKEVFSDPTSADESRWAYLIIDFPYDAEMAKGLNPELAEEIEEHADQAGHIVRPPETLEMSGQVEDVSSFQRPMITLTEVFLRDQECYMRPEQAVAEGHFHTRQVGTGDWSPNDAGELAEEQREGIFAGEGPEDPSAAGGEEIFPPGHEKFDAKRWPTRRTLRHITLVASRSVVLADRECAYWDFPGALNINIPILGKPYGIGEPYRHRAKADARTRLLTNAVNHSDWFKGPMTWGPASAREQFEEDYTDGFMAPDRHLWIPDDLILKTNGKPMGVQDPPQLPPVLLALDQKLKREINDDSGNMSAIQGQPAESLGNLSGVAIGMIQNGAASLASFKAQRMEHVVERIARLGLHSILTRMTAADVWKIVKKYPLHVLEALWDGSADLEWNIKVVLSAGAGATLQQKKAESIDKFKMGLASKQTTRERIGEDPALEEKRINDETLKDLQFKAQVQQMMAPPPAPPQPAAVPQGAAGPQAPPSPAAA